MRLIGIPPFRAILEWMETRLTVLPQNLFVLNPLFIRVRTVRARGFERIKARVPGGSKTCHRHPHILEPREKPTPTSCTCRQHLRSLATAEREKKLRSVVASLAFEDEQKATKQLDKQACLHPQQQHRCGRRSTPLSGGGNHHTCRIFHCQHERVAAVPPLHTMTFAAMPKRR